MHQCLQLLGFASFAISAVPHARLYMRELQRVVIPLQVIQASMETRIQVSRPLQDNLRFCAHLQVSHASKSLELPPPRHQLFTDASDSGWGAACVEDFE